MIFIVVSRMLGARCFALGRDEKEEIDARYASVDDRSDRAVEGVQYALGATRVQGRCPKGSIKIRGCNEKE